ncbi:MAG: class I SAM-dependent methyltransferase [Thermodesulfovibrionales bacterium]
MKDSDDVYAQYFKNRNVTADLYRDFRIPSHVKAVLPIVRSAKILDIGCGFGQILSALLKMNYVNVTGIDISDEAVSSCLKDNLNVVKIDNIINFCFTRKDSNDKFDFIIMSHVLEHLKKEDVIETLRLIKTHLMNPEASLLVMVPNAQSNTGCYWAYEDFTHQTLFTAGSLYFVLKSAAFESIDFIDPDGLEGSRPVIRQIKQSLLFLYKANVRFWNAVTNSSFHRPSPQIFTYELKVLAK